MQDDLRLMILGNYEILRKSLKCLELKPNADLTIQKEIFWGHHESIRGGVY